VKILDHVGSVGVNPTRIIAGTVNEIARRSIGKKTKPPVPRSRIRLHPMVAHHGCAGCRKPFATDNAAVASRPERTMKPKRQLFRLFGLCPAGVLPDENGEGVAPPFLRFLSAFGFFFSLLLRICPLAMTISLAPG
jgi:hypothetical protein